MHRPRIVIITPASPAANNGNWQTASRWAQMLSGRFDVSIQQTWSGEPFAAMLALHARRSAPSIAAWAQAHPASPKPAMPAAGLAVVLTGTDLYRDINSDVQAQKSLALASQLMVLHELGARALPAKFRSKTRVMFQSTTTRQTLPKTNRHLRVLMVGHLRDEKSPQTLFEAAKLLAQQGDILIDHIGDALDPALGAQALACAKAHPRYRWLGGLAPAATRQRIQRAHLLVHASRMEGGAHVVMEAVCSGTPVLASRIDGNVGMLGANYPGYFPVGDAQSLADLLVRARQAQSVNTTGTNTNTNINTQWMAELARHCAMRAPLFSAQHERTALIDLVNCLLQQPSL
jgi:putative glycosyltransferase (TIGR04348 family)